MRCEKDEVEERGAIGQHLPRRHRDTEKDRGDRKKPFTTEATEERRGKSETLNHKGHEDTKVESGIGKPFTTEATEEDRAIGRTKSLPRINVDERGSRNRKNLSPQRTQRSTEEDRKYLTAKDAKDRKGGSGHRESANWQ
jgi:hypothetical protein